MGDAAGQEERLYRVVRAVSSPLYRLLTPVRVVGAERLPMEGPVIVAANHVSFFDTVVLMLSVPRKTYFVGKAEYMDSWKTRTFFRALGLIPIERSAARQAVAVDDRVIPQGCDQVFPQSVRCDVLVGAGLLCRLGSFGGSVAAPGHVD